MTTTDRLLCAILGLGLLAAGCGSPDSTARTSPATRTGSAEEARLAPVDTKGDPRDLVSFTNVGTAQTLARYDTYEELRDYGDLAMIGTIEELTVTEPYEEPYLMPGKLRIDMTIDVVLGGRMTDLAPGDPVYVSLPFGATADQWTMYKDRLNALRGARFAMFLQQSTAEGERRFTPMLYNAPNPILAEWPGDGRLTALMPHDYLALDAIQRGVEKTGVPYEGEPEWSPTFEGGSPIGMTVAEAAEQFAGTPGQPAVDPPEGWESLEPLLADVPKGD